MVVDPDGAEIHDKLSDDWRIVAENTSFREKVLQTAVSGDKVENSWVQRRPIHETDVWFETAWARFRSGEVYDM